MRSILEKLEKQLKEYRAKLGNPSPAGGIDEKIKSKLHEEMKRRNFSEADATRHVIDRDRGEKAGQQNRLLQAEQESVKYNSRGQWKIEKSNYGPKGMGLYSLADNSRRKMKNTGETHDDAGKNVNAKMYTTSGSSVQQAHEAAEARRQKEKSKASTKIFTDEEKKA